MADYEKLTGTVKQGKDRRRLYYHAINKREIQQELEKRLGGGFTTPDRVWNGDGAKLKGASGDRPSAAEAARLELRAMADSTETIRWHKHWIVLIRYAIVPSILVLLLIAASAALWFWRDTYGNSLIPMGIAVWATVFASAWLLWRIENWRNDEYILERDLLIDIEATPLGVQKSKRTADLARIVDLTYRINGPIHTLFNYGDVLAQTAGTDGYFSFVDVGAPSQVVETIRRRMDERAREEERRQTHLRARELPDWLEVYSRVDPNLADRMDEGV
jgi:membrane protein YdbS with pleckstrin-like domain